MKKESLKNSTPKTSLTKEEQVFFKNLQNRRWRLDNLYYIKTKSGKKIKFKMNFAQLEIFNNLWFFSIILKARQLGITTFFCVLYLDQVLFSENKTAGIIAHKQDDAKKIFKDKVKFAWDNLPQILKDYLGPPDTDTKGELSFKNGSKIFVSTSTRSGTVQFLHISEFAKLCASFPGKAQEVVTGSINSVDKGNFVTIESTAEGRDGYFYDFCQEAQKALKENRKLSLFDFKFFFFPWWQNPEYRLNDKILIPKEYQEYFDNLLERHNIKLDDGQKKWYVSKKKWQKEDMFREYPSTPEEAFMASIEGSYFKGNMAKVYEQKRIMNIPYDQRLPCETWWDLGMNDTNVILITQAFGNEIRFVDLYANNGEGLAHYVNKLNTMGYVFKRHNLPHDIEVRELGTGKSRKQVLLELGLNNIRTIERSPNINDDIELVRGMFSRFYFDEGKTKPLVDALEGYRKEWDDKTGEFKNTPRHDKHSHYVSPIRILARGWDSHAVDLGGQKKEDAFQDFF